MPLGMRETFIYDPPMAASTTRRRKRWLTWRHAARRAGDRYDRIWFHASSKWSATRDSGKQVSIPVVIGCAPPNTRRAIRSVSSCVAIFAAAALALAAAYLARKKLT